MPFGVAKTFEEWIALRDQLYVIPVSAVAGIMADYIHEGIKAMAGTTEPIFLPFADYERMWLDQNVEGWRDVQPGT